jgi:hypothetical protein
LVAQTEENKYQKVDREWLECMMRIGRKELDCFEEYSERYTEQIVTMNCRRAIMTWVYSTLKNAKKITPIEDLDIGAKKQMWAFVLEICNGRNYDKKRMLDICKTFYVIEYFLNEKTNG